jgi:hypothetical protein
MSENINCLKNNNLDNETNNNETNNNETNNNETNNNEANTNEVNNNETNNNEVNNNETNNNEANTNEVNNNEVNNNEANTNEVNNNETNNNEVNNNETNNNEANTNEVNTNEVNNNEVNNNETNNNETNNNETNNNETNNNEANTNEVNNNEVNNNEVNELVRFEHKNIIKLENNVDNIIIQPENNAETNNSTRFIECDVTFKGVNLLNYENPTPAKLQNKDIKNLNQQTPKYRIYMCVCGTVEQNFLNASLSIKSFRNNQFTGPIDVLTDDLNYKPCGATNIIYVPKTDISTYSALKLKPFEYLTIKKDEILIYIDPTIVNLRPLKNIYLNDKIAVCGIIGKKENIKSHKIINAVSFNTSILVFRPSIKVKNLFTSIYNEYILSRKNKNQFEKPYTHSYIVKNLLINDMVDYSLTEMVITDINKTQIKPKHIFGNFVKETIQEKEKILEYISQTIL